MLNDAGEPTGSGCSKCHQKDEYGTGFCDHWDKTAESMMEENPELQK
jgi:hypothetical protein